MSQTIAYTQVADTCLLAGKIILQNGGETYRVEDTMVRIAAAYGIESSQSYVTPTGILFAIEGTSHETKLIRITERDNNLTKVSLVNDISRRISNGELAAEEAYRLLQAIDTTSYNYSSTVSILAAAAASGGFLFMFGGEWYDVFPVLFIGGIGYLCFLAVHHFVSIKFFAEFLTAILIGTLSVAAVRLGLGHNLDKIIICSVIPLVPGLHITNAIRDLMAGHLVSGLSKGAEAFLTASAIGAGIAAVLSIWSFT